MIPEVGKSYYYIYRHPYNSWLIIYLAIDYNCVVGKNYEFNESKSFIYLDSGKLITEEIDGTSYFGKYFTKNYKELKFKDFMKDYVKAKKKFIVEGIIE